MVSKKACWDRCRLAEIVEGGALFMVFQAIREVFMGTWGDHMQVSWKCSIVSRRLQEMSRRAWWKLRRLWQGMVSGVNGLNSHR